MGAFDMWALHFLGNDKKCLKLRPPKMCRCQLGKERREGAAEWALASSWNLVLTVLHRLSGESHGTSAGLGLHKGCRPPRSARHSFIAQSFPPVSYSS